MTNQSAPIEVDPAVLAHDGEDYASSGYATTTTSLSSSVQQYIYENGRRYHSHFGINKNPMPTDEKEQDRLDLHHEILLQLMDYKHHLAPLDTPHRILDIGTGTGIWAVDMAYRYPCAEVTGTDLSPIQPKWVPPNCKFEVDDAETDWTFRPDSFDFIHVRNLNQAISNWPKVMSEIYRCTMPGGYVELAELGCKIFSDDGTLTDESGFSRYLAHLADAMRRVGRPNATAEILTDRLWRAGFVDVQVVSHKQPFGPWPKDKHRKHIGAMTLLMAETGIFEAYGMAPFTRVLGFSADEAARICREGVEALRNKNFHVYSYFHVAYGRKPEL